MKFYAVKILCEGKRFFWFTLDYLLVSFENQGEEKNRYLAELVAKLIFSGMG